MSLFFVSLVDSSAAEASSTMSHHLRRVWSCPTCHTSMPVTVAEQLHHQSTCAISEAKSTILKKYNYFSHELFTIHFGLCYVSSVCY